VERLKALDEQLSGIKAQEEGLRKQLSEIRARDDARNVDIPKLQQVIPISSAGCMLTRLADSRQMAYLRLCLPACAPAQSQGGKQPVSGMSLEATVWDVVLIVHLPAISPMLMFSLATALM